MAIFNYFIPIIIGLWSLPFILVSSKILLKKKPLIFSSKFLFILKHLFPITMALGILPSAEFSFLIFLLLIILFVFLWKDMTKQSYDFVGFTNNSFRDALFATLKQQNLEWKEEQRLIYIPSENLDINLYVSGHYGRIENKTKQSKEPFERIIGGIKKQISAGNIDINKKVAILPLIFGIIVLVVAVALANLASN